MDSHASCCFVFFLLSVHGEAVSNTEKMNNLSYVVVIWHLYPHVEINNSNNNSYDCFVPYICHFTQSYYIRGYGCKFLWGLQCITWLRDRNDSQIGLIMTGISKSPFHIQRKSPTSTIPKHFLLQLISCVFKSHLPLASLE